MLVLIQRNLKVSSIKAKELAYKALVRPHLEYASTVWSPWQQGSSAMLEKVQRHAARFVLNDYIFPCTIAVSPICYLDFNGTLLS